METMCESKSMKLSAWWWCVVALTSYCAEGFASFQGLGHSKNFASTKTVK